MLINILPTYAKSINPAPNTIPTDILQNKNTMSKGSLIAALNLTIDKAPTMPKDNTTLLVTANITNVVIKHNPIKLVANDELNIMLLDVSL